MEKPHDLPARMLSRAVAHSAEGSLYSFSGAECSELFKSPLSLHYGISV